MGAIADLWKSERGIVAVLLIIAATVLTALNRMTVDAWREFSLYVFGVYAGAKTATGIALIMKSPKPADAAETAVTPPGA